jgi:hypothetical protein
MTKKFKVTVYSVTKLLEMCILDVIDISTTTAIARSVLLWLCKLEHRWQGNWAPGDNLLLISSPIVQPASVLQVPL